MAGCTVVVNGRQVDATEGAAEEITRATGATVVPVAADLDTMGGPALLLAAVSQVDILVNNNAGPPFRDYRDVDRDSLMAGVEANMATPIGLAQAVLGGMVKRRFGRIVSITLGSVKMPLPGLDVSSGARAGLTAFLAGVARSVAYANVTINFMLPGSFATDRLHSMYQGMADEAGTSVEESAAAAEREDPRRSGRHAVRVRRPVRVPLFGAGRLHHGPEFLTQRRRFPWRSVGTA